MSGYPTERFAIVKQQKIDDDPILPLMDHGVDVQWLPGMTRKTIFSS